MRVSTEKQHIGNQREEIGRFAERHGLTVDRWVTETASGRKSNRERKLGRVSNACGGATRSSSPSSRG